MTGYAKAEAPHIRARLEKLKSQIERVGHGAATAYWVGDAAAEQQIRHDWKSGRTMWETAWENCGHGLEAMDDGDYDLALTFLLEAQAMAIDALRVRLAAAARKGDGLHRLAKPAGKAGPPRKHPIKPAGPTRPRGRPRKKVTA